METYLPVRKSLGYQNLKKALAKIFSICLDDEEINVFEFENFKYILNYKKNQVKLFITDTEKNVQFQFGEGGVLSIYLPNPEFPDHSFLPEKPISDIISDKEQSLFLEFVSGKRDTDVESAVRILKDYLDKLSVD